MSLRYIVIYLRFENNAIYVDRGSELLVDRALLLILENVMIPSTSLFKLIKYHNMNTCEVWRYRFMHS